MNILKISNAIALVLSIIAVIFNIWYYLIYPNSENEVNVSETETISQSETYCLTDNEQAK